MSVRPGESSPYGSRRIALGRLLHPRAYLRRARGVAGRETAWGLLFLSPWLLGLALFTLVPMGASLVLSLTDFDLLRPGDVRFVGLANYERMLRDPLVAHSLGVTLKFALISIPVTLGVALGLALLLNHRLLAAGWTFRTLF